MITTLTFDLDIKLEENTSLNNLENEIKTTINNLDGYVLENGFLIKDFESEVENNLYINKDICAEAVLNTSIQKQRVPNSNEYRFLKKERESYLFLKENPKPIKFNMQDYDGMTFDSNYDVEILSKLSTNIDSKKVYSFKYGGIDERDLLLYLVDNSSIMRKLTDYTLDVVEGLLYTDLDFNFICATYNINPLKIIPKDSLKITEKESGFYSVINAPSFNQVLITENKDHVRVTFLKECVIRIPSTSNLLKIDGVTIPPNQILFVEKNETLLFEKSEEEILTEEFLSQNTKLYDMFDETDLESILKENYTQSLQKTEDYFIEIIDKELVNTYKKRTPIILKLF